MSRLNELEFDLKMCGKRVYVTYFELWNKPGFDEQPVRELMKQTGKDEGGIKMCIQSARRIAKAENQTEALKVIMNSPRVDRVSREKAAMLLRSII